MDSEPGQFWINFDLPLEAELAMEKQCRLARDCEDLDKMREVIEALIRQNYTQQFMLTQFVSRVAELEAFVG